MSDKKGKKIKEEIEKLKKEIEDNKSKYLRALADYNNLEKRSQDEKLAVINYSNKHFILKLLPIIDNLDKAEIFIKDEGLKIIKSQFLQILKEEGVNEIELLNKEFDPETAEAVDVVDGARDNVIIEVLQKGYKAGDKVLRPAQVRVSKKIS